MIHFFRRKALALTLKQARRLFDYRQNNSVDDRTIQKEIALYIKASRYCDHLIGSKSFPYAQQQAMECLRAAASLDDVVSSRVLGERMLKLGQFWIELNRTPLENDFQRQMADQCFNQSKLYLDFAKDRGDIRAMRLLGVLLVNGYGVDLDMDSGLKLITDSITLENAWSKSSEIFAEHGLDRPEFFTRLMKMKGGQTE